MTRPILKARCAGCTLTVSYSERNPYNGTQGYSYAYKGRGVAAGSFLAAYPTLRAAREAGEACVRRYNPKAPIIYQTA